ncbi:mobilization protein MobS [Moraxella osloensis]|uniref:mobilization protein MobS n=1 Tax=Faucicola osloensis TaxID=34062 RepID=UPI0020053C1F|nr:mobilization protein MobS [Moraxella osloensis]MCK6053312.1 mobilization protein MobS [Moraxella osloensis]
MSLLIADDDKELARLNELERQLKLKKEKMDKNATRQKILLGAFLLDLLENDKLPGLRNYTIENLEDFVNRDGEKNLVKPVITNVKKLMGVKIEKQSLMANASSEINQHDNLDNQNNADSLNDDLTKLADNNFGN